MGDKKAILVVSFGTSHQDTLEKTIQAIETEMASAFPGWIIRRAFTSGMIVKKLRASNHMAIDTVSEALDRLHGEGIDTVVCQPTHIMNGEEYDDIVADCLPWRERFASFAIGAPLLSRTADYRQLAEILSRHLPPREDTALCLMGHGTTHFADSAYAALDYHFKDLGRGDIFVGTVEGFPDFDTLLRHVKAYAPKRVVLAPLMVVAGDHAKNDMAGDAEDSWKSVLEAAGYEVRCVLTGLGEYAGIREMYVDHAGAVAGKAAC